ncbi:MAG: helix-hairpin-helix domain-containing protein, partial [Bacteroidales bacterium]|nr:helix-hairpin-helix domain-containing protein [Bacteroidales bacterium]
MRKRVADAGQITPSKAKGVIGLMALMLIYQIGVFVVEKCSSKESKESLSNSEGQAAAQLFEFNPNTIPIDSLQMLGFSQKEAATVIHYRDKGGKFLKKRDFAKLYVVDEAKYLLLEPYIKLPDSIAREKVQATQRRGFTKKERAKPSAKTKEHFTREYSTKEENKREYSQTGNTT